MMSVLSELAVGNSHFARWFVSNFLIYFVNEIGHMLLWPCHLEGRKELGGSGTIFVQYVSILLT
jgi:hypothetical protein